MGDCFLVPLDYFILSSLYKANPFIVSKYFCVDDEEIVDTTSG